MVVAVYTTCCRSIGLKIWLMGSWKIEAFLEIIVILKSLTVINNNNKLSPSCIKFSKHLDSKLHLFEVVYSSTKSIIKHKEKLLYIIAGHHKNKFNI